MSNPQIQASPTTTSSRIRVPAVVPALFIAAPVLLLFGGFLARVNPTLTFDWAIFQTMLGTVMFWVGVLSLMTAIVLVGVRSIAQQQLNVLLEAGRGGGDQRDAESVSVETSD